MNRRITKSYLILAILFALSPFKSFALPSYIVAGYAPGWDSNPGYAFHSNFSSAIPWSDLSHVYYAFATVGGTTATMSDPNAIAAAICNQAHAHGVRCYLSVGGANGNTWPTTNANAQALANSITSLIHYGGVTFDGIDVDWEFPTTPSVFNALLTQIHSNLSSITPGLAPSGNYAGESNEGLSVYLSPGSAVCGYGFTTSNSIVDWYTFSGYDLNVNVVGDQWNGALVDPSNKQFTNCNSNSMQLSITTIANWYNTVGFGGTVPYNKMILGMPFYGHNNGGTVTTPDAVAFNGSGTGYNATAAEEVWGGYSMDTAQSFCDKMNWAIGGKGMKGIAMWDLGQGLPTNANSMMTSIWNVIGGSSACLTFGSGPGSPTATPTSTPSCGTLVADFESGSAQDNLNGFTSLSAGVCTMNPTTWGPSASYGLSGTTYGARVYGTTTGCTWGPSLLVPLGSGASPSYNASSQNAEIFHVKVTTGPASGPATIIVGVVPAADHNAGYQYNLVIPSGSFGTDLTETVFFSQMTQAYGTAAALNTGGLFQLYYTPYPGWGNYDITVDQIVFTCAPTPTPTPTNTNTATFTKTNTPTYTATFTFTNTTAATNTFTLTPTFTNSFTNTPTKTFTSTNSFTNTPTITNTFTNTSTKTNTPTNTSTYTHTFTNTPANTNTFTNTFTPTFTRTFTNSPTNSLSPTNTGTPTNTNTGTQPPTNTPTNSLTPTRTFTNTSTPTNSFTDTFTNTPALTSTYTFTPTNTGTPTFTNTSTSTSTSTSTGTSTSTSTNTNTPTFTNTPTITSTFTDSPTGTLSPSNTPTNTGTFTNTSTSTWTGTFTNSPTPTFTSAFTNTSTVTDTASFTLTPSPTSTATATYTATQPVVQVGNGNNSPGNQTIPAGSSNQVVLQLSVNDTSAENLQLNGLTLTFNGTGNAATGISTITLWKDPSGNGTTAGSSVLATIVAPFASGNTALVNFSDIVGAGTTQDYLVTYNFYPGASAGTYSVSVANGNALTGQGVISTKSLQVQGAPVNGAIYTVSALTATPSFTPTVTSSFTATFTTTPTFTRTPLPVVTMTNPYPNPVSDSGVVSLDVTAPADSSMSWSVFTTSFRKVWDDTIPVPAGHSTIHWNLRDRNGVPVSDGLYYIRIQVTGLHSTTHIFKVLVLQ